MQAQQAENNRTKKNIRECDILYDVAAIDKATKELRFEEENARDEKVTRVSIFYYSLGTSSLLINFREKCCIGIVCLYTKTSRDFLVSIAFHWNIPLF